MTAASSIYIKGMRTYARHGVMEQERQVGAWFVIDLKVECDLSRAAQTDRVEDTISYADLATLVTEAMQQPSCLLEHVAGRICSEVLQRFPKSHAVSIRLTKENPPMGIECQGAGVELTLMRYDL